MKIAIIGGTGLLGSNLVKLYQEYEVRAYSRNLSNNIEDKYNIIIDFDMMIQELERQFVNWKPDIIINCVAIVNLELCERDYNLAYKINVAVAEDLAKLSKKLSAYFIHISTDHFFNDSKVIHAEEDKFELLNNYAKTKFLAENNVLRVNANSLIVRTNIIGFRRNGNDSFFEWLLNTLIHENTLNLFRNYYTSPISVYFLGELLLKCYLLRLKGRYNIASRDVIDKYSFGKKVADKFNLSNRNIVISYIDNTKLKRALTLGLDTSKIEKELDTPMPTVDQTINQLYKEYKENGLS